MFNWQKLGIDVGRIKTEGKTRCPKCGPTSKHKNAKNLSVNVQTGYYNCHNSPCDFRGYAGDGFLQQRPQPKVYEKPLPRLQKVSDAVVEWFDSRGISNNTLLTLKITESVEYISALEAKTQVVCFNYFRDEELINIKFRARGKHFGMTKNNELIFYNLDTVKTHKKLIIIVEGEIDAATWVECGHYNVISVPNGASQKREDQQVSAPKLEYLDNCWRELEGVEEFLIAVDDDEPGRLLQAELIRRLGPERCWTALYPNGWKDTNEVLLQGCRTKAEMIEKYGFEAITRGKQMVNELLKTAKAVPIDGVLTMMDLEADADYIFQYGYPNAFKIDWQLDEHLRWLPGDMTVVTGIPNHGKSTWLNNVLVRLADKHHWRIAVFSPEKNRGAFIVAELASILIGCPAYRADPTKKMSVGEWRTAKDFIHEHFLFLKTSGIDLTLDGLLSIGEKMVKRYGINGYVIDPWNYVETDIPYGQTETVWLGNQLSKAGDFAKKYGVHLWFVAHPTKMEKDKKTHKFLTPNLYSISGSANWNNKIDNGVVVYRNYDTGTTTVMVLKVRWFFVGRGGGSVEMKFDPDCQRFIDAPPEVSPDQANYEMKIANKKMQEEQRQRLKAQEEDAELVEQGEMPF